MNMAGYPGCLRKSQSTSTQTFWRSFAIGHLVYGAMHAWPPIISWRMVSMIGKSLDVSKGIFLFARDASLSQPASRTKNAHKTRPAFMTIFTPFGLTMRQNHALVKLASMEMAAFARQVTKTDGMRHFLDI